VDQRADAGDDEDHHRRQCVEAQRQVDRQVRRGEPGEERLVDLPRLGRHVGQRPHLQGGDRKRDDHHQRGHAARHGLGQPLPHRRVDEEAGERKQGNQRQQRITI
jgi:hypothetical protein